jgi:hypothetical protein
MAMTGNRLTRDGEAKPEAELHRLIYCSRNRISGSSADTIAEIEGILSAAQRNNAACDITGALIFNSGIFAQVLEGSRGGIETTFERIQRDPRHGDVNILAFEPTPQRFFPSWSMAFVGRSHAGRDLFSHIAFSTGFDERRLEGERILSLIQEIALEEENVA